MSGVQWLLGAVVVVAYLACLFWVGIRTFERGHFVLGVLGIFLPLLWIVGAFLPDRRAV